MVESIEFDGREAARPVRNDKTIKPFLAPSDDARTGTVKLKDSTPDRVIERVVGEAAETREKEAEKFGSVALTESERDEIDFTKTDIPTARAAKAAAAGSGVGDWLSYFDETLTASENRQRMKSAKTEGGGRRNEGRETGKNAKRLAKANKRRKAEAGDRVRDFALLQQDDAAQDELRSQGSFGDVFDVGFSRRDGRTRGQGEDFRRLQEVHENRSERAQRVDERRQAKTTRDPIQWANNPAKYDFPGIDTVQPQELHEQRSEKAQRVDERNIAPTAESKEQWARNPDKFDLPGVDRPERNRQPQRLSSFGQMLSLAEQNLGRAKDAAQSFQNSQQSGGMFTDDRDTDSQLLDFGMETDATQHRESRQDVEQASVFGVDDRSQSGFGSNDDDDDTEQQGFEVFGGGVRENQTLF